MDAPAVSVLVPTRGRPDGLRRGNASLRENTSLPIEFLVGVDPDDLTMDRYDFQPDELVVRFDERHGYRHLYRYYNTLAETARAPWLLLWNDDTICETGGWAEMVVEHDQDVVLNPTGNMGYFEDQTFFPVFPRAYVEITGHVSLSPQVDTWIQEVVRPLGRLIPLPMWVQHDRHDLTGAPADSTYQERYFDHDNLWGPEQTRIREVERELLRQAGWHNR